MNIFSTAVAASLALGCAGVDAPSESEQDGTAVEALVTGSLYVAPVTVPSGGVWVPGNATVPGHEWVADHLQGFCRTDETAPGSGVFTINAATCMSRLQGINSAGQAAVRTSSAGTFVYVPDNSSKGTSIIRFQMSADGQAVADIASIGPANGLSVNRPDGATLSPNGVLYVGSRKNGDIWRITNPQGTSPVATRVGQSSDGKSTFGLSVGGADLFVAEKNTVTVVRNVDAKATFVAAPTTINAIAPTAITFAPRTNELFIGNANSIVRFPLPNGPTTPFATTGDGVTGLAFVTALNVDAAGNLLAGDDPGAGIVVNAGHIWRYLAVP